MQLKTGCNPESAHLNSTIRQRNKAIRMELAELDRKHPESASHAQRVAVYATALAERLGYDLSDLVEVRIAAQRHDLDDQPSLGAELGSVIQICEAFDNRLRGCHGQLRISESEAIAWLASDAEKQYGRKLTDALASVHLLIQPVEP